MASRISSSPVGHPRNAADHNPVFGAVPVRPQAQPSAGLYLDALDLEPFTLLQHRVAAPRPVCRRVEPGRIGPFGSEPVIDLLDVLDSMSVANEQRICRIDHEQVPDPKRSGRMPKVAIRPSRAACTA